MTTTTIRTCDFCGGALIAHDREKWGVLIVGEYRDKAVKGIARDVCPVCIAQMRGARRAS